MATELTRIYKGIWRSRLLSRSFARQIEIKAVACQHDVGVQGTELLQGVALVLDDVWISVPCRRVDLVVQLTSSGAFLGGDGDTWLKAQ